MQRSVERFVNELAEASPQIELLRQKQLRDYREILVHLMLADVVRYLLSVVDGESTGDWPPTEAVRAVHVLESWYASDPSPPPGPDEDPVANAIAVSFIENLPSPEETSRIFQLLPPTLLRSYDRWWKEGLF